jgi:hypothetical protein
MFSFNEIETMVVVLNDICNVNREFPETGAPIFLHYPTLIRVYSVTHDWRKDLSFGFEC